jgi:hypothetical protein
MRLERVLYRWIYSINSESHKNSVVYMSTPVVYSGMTLEEVAYAPVLAAQVQLRVVLPDVPAWHKAALWSPRPSSAAGPE